MLTTSKLLFALKKIVNQTTQFRAHFLSKKSWSASLEGGLIPESISTFSFFQISDLRIVISQKVEIQGLFFLKKIWPLLLNLPYITISDLYFLFPNKVSDKDADYFKATLCFSEK